MLEINLPKETTDKWAEMTNENAHRDVRIEIAKFFDLDNYVKIFTEIKESIETKHYWERFCLDLYLEATKTMLYWIEVVYGKDIAQRVNNCL